MKKILLTFLMSVFSAVAVAQVSDPITDYKTDLIIVAGDKILKWECDINGDGKNEVLFTLKSEYDKNSPNHNPGWSFYIADALGNTFTKPVGTEYSVGVISVDDQPIINPDCCFIGQIAELGKRGLVSIETAAPREGDAIAKIYAYTIEGDHLKRTLLSTYLMGKGPNSVYTKYLSETKRTTVTLQELTP